MNAALYRTRVAHGRTERVTHGFAYRHSMWLVDLDDVPLLPRPLRLLGRFDARDHLGDPTSTIRANVDAYLATEGVDLRGGRVLMFTNARSWGYTFNPLSVFWCYGQDGELAGVVSEVHNTYGERHCYFLRPDAHGRADATKEFYVSPFFPVDGHYEMRFTEPVCRSGTEPVLRSGTEPVLRSATEPVDHLELEISLLRGATPTRVFRAKLEGWVDPARPSFLAGSLRHPFASRRVMALIKLQGIRLWLRRLPLVPRPIALAQKGVAS